MNTLASHKLFMVNREQASVQENPNFTSTACGNVNLLKVNTGVATQIESGGVPGTGITDDFENESRNDISPDIGADEFTGIAADLTGPSISYTAISNTACLTAPTLSATITDASSVNTTGGTKPRLYYKKSTNTNQFVGNTNADDSWKYVEATNASSPFSFTMDYSILDGAAPTVGDVIQYFVVAADLAGTPNVGINAGTFVGATPTSVDLQGQSVTSIGGTPSSFTLLAPGLSGTVAIGAAETYATLTGVG
ncbi:MAG: hypothetical protein ACOVOV_04195, partial [Dolichospermum sp.]